MISNNHLQFLFKTFFLAIFIGSIGVNVNAQTINATQTDEIIIDNGASGKADPNDRIRYKVTITNNPGPAGTNTQLNIVPDPRTTFVPGSFRSSPLAIGDPSYTCTGNVGINVPVGSGVMGNDFDDNIPGLTVTAGTFSTTQGGSIMLAADGSFMYTPTAGFTGVDTYTYTLNDGNAVSGVTATNTALITITVSNLIWFIDNTGGGSGGDGRLTSPFKTLADFNAGSAAQAKVIYIEETGTNYDGGIILQNTENLFGEGHTGGANLANVLPFALAPNSKTLPNINGTRPVITNTTAGGDGIQLALANVIRGLNVGNSMDYAIDNNGSTGVLNISEVNIANGTGGGFSAELGGTPAVTLGSLSSAGGVAGISLASMGGAGFFTITGAVTIGGQSGEGIVLTSNSASFTINGLTTINTPAPASVGNSIGIVSTSGPVTFANIDINGRRNIGLLISTNTNTVTTGTVDIDNSNSVNAIGLSINAPISGSISLGATTVNNNAVSAAGANILNSGATVTFASGSALSNSNGNEINIDGGAANVTYNGSVTGTAGGTVRVVNRTGGTIDFQGTITHNATAVAIQVSSNSGGTLLFSGGTKTLNSSTQSAVNLSSNTGMTMNFTNGGLAITTTSGTGFNATGGGTINVIGSGNTINSTSATALNVNSTTIGVSNLNFQSISSGNNTADPDPANGIILANTGSSGGLIVTGTGSANSGGTIQNMVGADDSGTTPIGTGIVLFNTINVSLKYMFIHDNSNYAIRGNGVTSFRFENSLINGVNGTNVASPFRDSGIRLDGCSGAININSNEITGGRQHNVLYDCQSGTSNLNFLYNNIHHTSAAAGDDGFQLEAETTATVFANVSNNIFTAHGGDHFNLSMINSANVDLTFKNNDMQGGHAIGLGQGVFILGATYNGTFKYDISNNGTIADPFIGNAQGAAIFVNKGSGTATYSGQIKNNVIGDPNITASGSSQSQGIHASARGAGGSHKTLIQDNLVREYFDRGIVLEAGEGAPSFTATVLTNTVSDFADATNSLHGIHCAFGILVADDAQITIDIRNNLIANAGNEPQGGVDFRMRTAGSNDVFIGGCATCTTAANTLTYIDGQNPDGTSFLVSLVGGGAPPATYNNGPAIPFSTPNLPTLPPAP